MTIKNWKKTSDLKNFEAWQNPSKGILITLNQQIPSSRNKKYLVVTHFDDSIKGIETGFNTDKEARDFISIFQHRNI